MAIPGSPAAVEQGADTLARAGNDLVAARDDVAGHAREALARFVGPVEALAAAQLEGQANAVMSGADACRAAGPVLRRYGAELRAAQQAYAAAEAQAAAGRPHRRRRVRRPRRGRRCPGSGRAGRHRGASGHGRGHRAGTGGQRGRGR